MRIGLTNQDPSPSSPASPIFTPEKQSSENLVLPAGLTVSVLVLVTACWALKEKQMTRRATQIMCWHLHNQASWRDDFTAALSGRFIQVPVDFQCLLTQFQHSRCPPKTGVLLEGPLTSERLTLSPCLQIV